MPQDLIPRRREIRRAEPLDFAANYAQGLRCLQQKRFVEAADSLSDALRAKPEDAAVLSNLGLALGAVGRFDEALAAFDGAIAAEPRSPEIHYNRGNLLRSRARPSDALRAYDAALALAPGFAAAIANRANALIDLGRDAEALAGYEQALAIEPRLAEALFNRATLLERMGRPAEALAAYDEALAVCPDSSPGLRLRGQLRARFGRTEEALDDFTRAARLDPGDAVVHTLRGDQLATLGRSEEALNAFEQAIRADPGFAEAHDRQGLMLAELGRLDQARRAHEKAVALAPRKAGFHYNLTTIARLQADDPNFLALAQLAREEAALPPAERIPLHFALAKAYEDQGRFEAAFDCLRKGNALKRATIAYDEPATLADMRTMAAIFTAKRLAEHRGQGDPATTPVFVLGMPRSGSTLVEQILASHPEAHGAGEITDFSDAAVAAAGENLHDLRIQDSDAFRDQLRRIGSGYIDRIRRRDAAAARIVNKMPANFLLAGLIGLALPNARIVHTRRNPVDTCLSCYSKLFSSKIPYAYDLAELGRYYRAYEGLMAHWRAALPAGLMLEVDYESLVADPETQSRRILAHCGLDWDSRCLDFHRTERPVRTASAAQVRRPIYTDAVGRRERFGANAAPLIAALGAGEGWLDRLRRFGGDLRRRYSAG